MSHPSTALSEKHCRPCSGEVAPLRADEVQNLLREVPGWSLAPGGDRIRREWRAKDFAAALAFFDRVGEVAEREDHHPDLHLTGYRNVSIELWTHAANGLTENDFILAAKIAELPFDLKPDNTAG